MLLFCKMGDPFGTQLPDKFVFKQEIVFKKDKATLHVISKRCEATVNYSN